MLYRSVLSKVEKTAQDLTVKREDLLGTILEADHPTVSQKTMMRTARNPWSCWNLDGKSRVKTESWA